MKNRVTPSIIHKLVYETKVKEAMSSDVVSVAPDDPILSIRKILREKRISGLLVVDDKKLVGIISLDNFINCVMDGNMDESVRENMSCDVEFVHNDELLIHAGRKFEEFGYGRLPVLKRETGELVGIITKGDIVKCLFRKLEIDYYKEDVQKYRASHIFEDISSDDTTISFKYKIKGGAFKTAGEKSGYMKVNLLRLGIPPKIARRATIASCEAEMNIIIFTDGGELLVNVDESKIKVNAIDNGPGIPDLDNALRPGFSTAPDWVREMGFGAGMGLPNIKECSDEMRIESEVGKGTDLEFIVNTA